MVVWLTVDDVDLFLQRSIISIPLAEHLIASALKDILIIHSDVILRDVVWLEYLLGIDEFAGDQCIGTFENWSD